MPYTQETRATCLSSPCGQCELTRTQGYPAFIYKIASAKRRPPGNMGVCQDTGKWVTEALRRRLMPAPEQALPKCAALSRSVHRRGHRGQAPGARRSRPLNLSAF